MKLHTFLLNCRRFVYLSKLRFYYIYIQVYILGVFNRKMKYGLTSNSSNNENAQIVQNNAQSINLSLLFHIGIVMLFIQVIQHFLTKLCVWAKGRIIISEIIVLRNLYPIRRFFINKNLPNTNGGIYLMAIQFNYNLTIRLQHLVMGC